jgi:Abnormal spindle-like microcephaly-assoc'd, ASPM-SPD-2-Hydin
MYGRYLLELALLTTAISIGCGGGTSTHQDVSAGQLIVSPSRLDFGNVAVGNTATKTGTLKAGNSSVEVTSADWSGEGYSITGITFPATVAAGQSVSFKVTFAPQKSGSSSGNVTFLSDASNSPHAEAFSANGTQAGAHSVSLAWHAGNSNTVGYNIYRGIQARGPFSKINSKLQSEASFTDSSVEPGLTYFYATTAVSKHGKESKYSKAVQVTIPNS